MYKEATAMILDDDLFFLEDEECTENSITILLADGSETARSER
jgi:hypothetical protein